VKNRFSQTPAVKIIRADSSQAIKRLLDRNLDVIYIDANHQYEYVLRDMMEARKKLKAGGILLLNDFYEGPGGAEQNLGAVNTFVKRYDFQYLAMSHGFYADVALTDDVSSPFVKEFLANLNNSELLFIGISDALVPNIRYKLYRKRNGELRYLAMLCQQRRHRSVQVEAEFRLQRGSPGTSPRSARGRRWPA
jgi:Methyltransferase domain